MAQQFVQLRSQFKDFIDIDELSRRIELIRNAGLDVLNDLIFECPAQQTLDFVAEHNTAVALIERGFGGLSYEPPSEGRVDLVGHRNELVCRAEVKRLGAPEPDRVQDRIIKHLNRALASHSERVWIVLEISRSLQPSHTNELVKSVKKALSVDTNKLYCYPTEDAWVVRYHFLQSKVLNHPMVAITADADVQDVTGVEQSRVIEKVRKAYRKFKGVPSTKEAHLVILEMDRTVHLGAVAEALYGTELIAAKKGSDALLFTRKNDGLFSKGQYSKLTGLMVARRTIRQVFAPYEFLLFPHPAVLDNTIKNTVEALGVTEVHGYRSTF